MRPIDKAVFASATRACLATFDSTGCGGDELVYSESEDTRTCSACSCGPPESICEGTVEFKDSSCVDSVLSTVNLGECVGSSPTIHNAQFKYSAWTASCPPAGGDLSGAAAPTRAAVLPAIAIGGAPAYF